VESNGRRYSRRIATTANVILSSHTHDYSSSPGNPIPTTRSHRVSPTNIAHLGIQDIHWNIEQWFGCHTRASLACHSSHWTVLAITCVLQSHGMYTCASQATDKTPFLDSLPQFRSALLSFLSALTIGSNYSHLGFYMVAFLLRSEPTYAWQWHLCNSFGLMFIALGSVSGLLFADARGSYPGGPCLIYCCVPLQMAFWHTEDISEHLLVPTGSSTTCRIWEIPLQLG
jgi:hypothetical protein